MDDTQTQTQTGTATGSAGAGQTTVQHTVTPLVLPVLPASGEEVYDRIMGGIEPDLTTANKALLETKYAGESDDEKKTRMERYTKAFEEYETQYAACMASMQQSVHNFERSARGSIEQDARTDETADLDTILTSIAAV